MTRFLVSLTLSAQSDIVVVTSLMNLPSITCDHSDDNNHDSSSSSNNMHKGKNASAINKQKLKQFFLQEWFKGLQIKLCKWQ